MYWLRGILNLLVSALAFACVMGLIMSILNRTLGMHFSFSGTEAPTEWQAILSFFLGSIIFCTLAHFLIKTDKWK